MKESHIIGSGGKRIRKGSYKTVYLDNHGKNRNGAIRYGGRGEIQTVNAGGAIRLRRWFKYREDAVRWINGGGLPKSDR